MLLFVVAVQRLDFNIQLFQVAICQISVKSVKIDNFVVAVVV